MAAPPPTPDLLARLGVEASSHQVSALGLYKVNATVMAAGAIGLTAFVATAGLALAGVRGLAIYALPVIAIPTVCCCAYAWWNCRRHASAARVTPEGLAWTQGGRGRSRPWADVRTVWRIDRYTLHGGGKP